MMRVRTAIALAFVFPAVAYHNREGVRMSGAMRSLVKLNIVWW
ncbi:hypothetical protein ACFLX9_01645 [Chloroflexota bacterium]